MQKTKIEILDETVEYYSTYNRGLDPLTGTCVYLNNNGDMCAIGRCMIEPKIKLYGTVGGLRNEQEQYLDIEKELKPEYRGHHIKFWSDLQRFHDNHGNWTPNRTLSLTGENLLKTLKEKYA